MDHLLASSSIPLLFPAVPLEIEGHHEWFGDGTMRQMSPLSPAIHLGASRIPGHLGGVAPAPGWFDTVPAGGYPSLAQVGGRALASIFLDGLQADIERLVHINQLLAHARGRCRYRRLAPGGSRDDCPERADRGHRRPACAPAAAHGARAARARSAAPRRAAAFASYLLFEPEFTQALLALGERDAAAEADAIAAFLHGVVPKPAPPSRAPPTPRWHPEPASRRRFSASEVAVRPLSGAIRAGSSVITPKERGNVCCNPS